MISSSMKLVLSLAVGAVLAAGCGDRASQPVAPAIRTLAIYGTSAGDVSASGNAEWVDVSFTALSSAGAFAQVLLPDGVAAESVDWLDAQNNAPAGVLTVALPNETGIEIGCVPVPGSEIRDIRARIAIGPIGRAASIAPTGAANIVVDLNVLDLGTGETGLGWTQTNAGDYDFNNEVNGADLRAIALNYLSTYDAAAPGKLANPLYWIDGDRNGEINQADITVIAQHYRSFVAGYDVRRNGVRLPGPAPGSPSVPSSAALARPNLPPHFQLVTAGEPGDTWVVTAIDADGNTGSDSNGNPGTTDLIANLQVTGLDLLDLTNGGGKITSRVIRPIEDVDSAILPTLVADSRLTYTALPKLQTLLLYFSYLPSVNLATGQPRSGSSERSAAALAADLVNTAIPVTLPNTPGTTTVDAGIELIENPAGGYFVELTTTITPAAGVPTTTTTRLDYANGRLNRDSNGDGIFDDEATFGDDDRDCVSNTLLERERDDNEYGKEGRQHSRMVATIEAVDQTTGTLTLSNITLFEGGLEQPAEPVVLRFSEQTEFEDGLTPSELLAGSRVEVKFYQLRDAAGMLPVLYWADSLGRENDEDFAWLEASDNRDNEIRVRWGQPVGYTHFYLKRYSFNAVDNDFTTLDWEIPFDAADEAEYEDTAVALDVDYKYVYFGKDNQAVFTELGSDLGRAGEDDDG